MRASTLNLANLDFLIFSHFCGFFLLFYLNEWVPHFELFSFDPCLRMHGFYISDKGPFSPLMLLFHYYAFNYVMNMWLKLNQCFERKKKRKPCKQTPLKTVQYSGQCARNPSVHGICLKNKVTQTTCANKFNNCSTWLFIWQNETNVSLKIWKTYYSYRQTLF